MRKYISIFRLVLRCVLVVRKENSTGFSTGLTGRSKNLDPTGNPTGAGRPDRFPSLVSVLCLYHMPTVLPVLVPALTVQHYAYTNSEPSLPEPEMCEQYVTMLTSTDTMLPSVHYVNYQRTVPVPFQKRRTVPAYRTS